MQWYDIETVNSNTNSQILDDLFDAVDWEGNGWVIVDDKRSLTGITSSFPWEQPHFVIGCSSFSGCPMNIRIGFRQASGKGRINIDMAIFKATNGGYWDYWVTSGNIIRYYGADDTISETAKVWLLVKVGPSSLFIKSVDTISKLSSRPDTTQVGYFYVNDSKKYDALDTIKRAVTLSSDSFGSHYYYDETESEVVKGWDETHLSALYHEPLTLGSIDRGELIHGIRIKGILQCTPLIHGVWSGPAGEAYEDHPTDMVGTFRDLVYISPSTTPLPSDDYPDDSQVSVGGKNYYVINQPTGGSPAPTILAISMV